MCVSRSGQMWRKEVSFFYRAVYYGFITHVQYLHKYYKVGNFYHRFFRYKVFANQIFFCYDGVTILFFLQPCTSKSKLVLLKNVNIFKCICGHWKHVSNDTYIFPLPTYDDLYERTYRHDWMNSTVTKYLAYVNLTPSLLLFFPLV